MQKECGNMNKIYLAPKNDKTILLSKTLKGFAGYIDKYKADRDCIKIEHLNSSDVEKLIIYSPQYHKEIQKEYLDYIETDKIRFYLDYGISTRSIKIASLYYIINLKFLEFKKKIKNRFKKSETSKVRKSLDIFCKGNGIDIGFGGDPITKSAITVDLEFPYAKYENNPLHLKGSGDNLYWFKDGVLDYVYSSHLLEDFEDTKSVLEEWIRVLKPNGHLILFLPNEQLYRAYCKQKGVPSNVNHIHEFFCLSYIKEIIGNRDDLQIVHQFEPSNIYSFELVIKKLK